MANYFKPYQIEKTLKSHFRTKILRLYKANKFIVIKDDLTNLISDFILDDTDILMIKVKYSLSYEYLSDIIENEIYSVYDWKYSIYKNGYTFLSNNYEKFPHSVRIYLQKNNILVKSGDLEIYGNHDK